MFEVENTEDLGIGGIRWGGEEESEPSGKSLKWLTRDTG